MYRHKFRNNILFVFFFLLTNYTYSKEIILINKSQIILDVITKLTHSKKDLSFDKILIDLRIKEYEIILGAIRSIEFQSNDILDTSSGNEIIKNTTENILIDDSLDFFIQKYLKTDTSLENYVYVGKPIFYGWEFVDIIILNNFFKLGLKDNFIPNSCNLHIPVVVLKKTSSGNEIYTLFFKYKINNKKHVTYSFKGIQKISK